MPDPNLYIDREQTYVKHFVLKRYLERVAYNILSFQNDFVYVDGFSGPWKSENDTYEDTSFKIALDQLRDIRKGIKDSRGKDVNFRCIFVEKFKKPFSELKEAVNEIDDVNIELINGAFEDHITEICNFAKQAFSLIFIDPTGWQGFPMQKISPLLMLRGEVLINFMSDFINRFIEDPRPEIASSFDDLFGENWYPEWKMLNDKGLSREAAAIEVYTSRLKQAGNFQFVTSTRILKPKADRSYFYLIYATQHWKGIQEFRKVEKKAIEEQEKVRNAAKYKANVSKTGQESLFGQEIMATNAKSYEAERKTQLARGHDKFLSILKANSNGIKYEQLIGEVLETPMVWENDLKEWITALIKQDKIQIPEMAANQRVPKKGNTIIPLSLSQE